MFRKKKPVAGNTTNMVADPYGISIINYSAVAFNPCPICGRKIETNFDISRNGFGFKILRLVSYCEKCGVRAITRKEIKDRQNEFEAVLECIYENAKEWNALTRKK